jgi:hypothetical protein
MFAPREAKPKATQPQRSTLLAQRPAQSAVSQAHMLQRSIGNQAMLRLLARRETAIRNEPDVCKEENDAARTEAHAAAPSWNFSKIPVFSPDCAGRFQMPPHLPAPRLPGPIQAKLKVGPVDDPLEHEADRVADQVMRMPAPEIEPAVAEPQISRKCAACEAEQEEERLQRKPVGTAKAGTSEAPASVHEALCSPGEPLDAATRAHFEPRFRHDFSRVRVHTDVRAAESARDVTAHAYTMGRNIVFDTGRFAPETQEGQKLLAHELTHVIQQSVGAIALQRAPAGDVQWKQDEKAARYRGQLMAKRIRTHGKLSKEARAKINSELAYFEGAAKDAYIKEVRPALLAVVHAEQKAPAELASEVEAKAPVLAELASEAKATFLPALEGAKEILTGGREMTPLERKEWEEAKQRELQEDEKVNNDPMWSVKGGSCTRAPNGWRVYRQIVHYYQSYNVPGAYFFTSDLFRDWCSGGMRKLRERWAKEKSAVTINNETDLLSIWLTEEGRERAKREISLVMGLIPAQLPREVRPPTSQVPATVPPTRRFLPRPVLPGPPAEFELPAPAKPGVASAEPTSELNLPPARPEAPRTWKGAQAPPEPLGQLPKGAGIAGTDKPTTQREQEEIAAQQRVPVGSKRDVRTRERASERAHEGQEREYTRDQIGSLRKQIVKRPRVSSIAGRAHRGAEDHGVSDEIVIHTINEPQVVLVAKNGNWVYYRNGTVVITPRGNVEYITTAYGSGGRIPQRRLADVQALYPEATFRQGDLEPPIKLDDWISQQSGPFSVFKIWP